MNSDELIGIPATAEKQSANAVNGIKKRPAGTAGRAIMYVMYLRAIELERSGNRIALGFSRVGKGNHTPSLSQNRT